MSDTPRAQRSKLTDWPIPAASTRTEDFYEDEDYIAPVKQNDAAMIQFLASRANKSQS